MRIDDPAHVARQYATEENLEARRALYTDATGPDPREITFQAVAEMRPKRVLEVGGGPGELAARIAGELGCDVVMVDISPRMVELAILLGVDARVGDVQSLTFQDGTFDCAVAAWMLFHVPEIDAGLAELARVLRPSGRLVATTNSVEHLVELREIAGSAAWARTFTRENGAGIIGRHFDRVERRDADGWVTIDDQATVEGFVASLDADEPLEPRPYALPLRTRRASSVFVARSSPRLQRSVASES
ncbi:MAG TPA: methyltransferase domain-containing protein [Gaiella sp.]